MVERRAFLRRAAVAGTGAFVVPTIVTVDPAGAQALTSPPPQPPGQQSPPIDHSGPTTTGSSSTAAGGTQRSQATGQGVTGLTEIPRTGADIDRLVMAGLAATAGGAALMLWSADAKSKPAAAAPADPELET